MTRKEKAKKLLAAGELLSGETTTKEKLAAIQHLIKGIDPELEKKYKKCVELLNSLGEAIKATDVIELAAEKLPGNTPEQKKRKKVLLLFITAFKDLRSEVNRLHREMERSEVGERSSKVSRMASMGRVLAFAKGPLGIVTIAAVLIVALKPASATITVKNQGCSPLIAKGMPISIPGIQLPTEPILSGGEGTVKLPSIKYTIDNTVAGKINLKVLGLGFDFEKPGQITDLVYAQASLLGKKTIIALGSNISHELVVRCD